MTHRSARPVLRTLALLALCALAACVPHVGSRPGPAGRPEARSLFGQPLYPPELPLEARQRAEAQLDSARQAYDAAPDDADVILTYGRRLAALGRYREAIGMWTEGIGKHPRDARFYRYRGHRWITLRKFDRAVGDLEKAERLLRGRPDQPEPDGSPGTTLQQSVWYHLGIGWYLRGDFPRAAQAFRYAMAASRGDDQRVASTDWLYMSLRRAGRTDEARAALAAIPVDVKVTESRSYLQRLRMYRGEIPPDSLLDPAGKTNIEVATQSYGAGNWYLYNGRTDDAEQVFWKITQAENWAPFGYIAAEADLRRLTRADARRVDRR
ncbi:MAG TPA: tetratricopeptide repeat protein [Longimicrobiaceae bacterium]